MKASDIPVDSTSTVEDKIHVVEYFQPSDPLININPTRINVLWVNTDSGEIFTCTDNTPDNNQWIGNSGTVIKPAMPQPLDVFGDGSCIAQYKFENTLGDESGLYDLTGISYSFVSPGKYGSYCIQIPPSEYLTSSDMDWNVLSAGFAISTWFKPYASTDYNMEFFRLPTGDYTLLYTNDDVRFRLSWNGTYSDYINYQDKWFHYVFSYDGTNVNIYLDNSLVLSLARTISWSDPYPLRIGLRYWSASNHPNSYDVLDNYRVFNRSITTSEINTLFNE